MAGVEFAIALLDKVSAPARKVATGLGLIEAKAKGLSGIDPLKNIKPPDAKYYRDAAGRLRDAVTGKFTKVTGVGGGFEELFGKPDFSPVITGLKYVTAAATVAAAAAAAVFVAFGKATLDAAIFRETSIKSLDVAFGAGQGAGQFELARNLALRYGESLETVVGAMREFKTAGFSDKTGQDLFAGLQDLRVASPNANIPNLILAIKQIQAAGKLQGDELNQLGEAGLGKNLVFDALAKKLGKTVPELTKMQEAGQLTSDVVIPAILESIKSLAGGKELGSLAQDVTKNTLGGALRGLTNLPGLLFDSIAKNVDTKSLTGLVTGLTDFLTGPQVASALASAGTVFGSFVEAGAAVLGSIGGALGGLFGGLAPTGQSFADALISGAGAIKDAAPAIGELVTAVGGPLVSAFQSVSESFAGMSPEAKAAGFAALSQLVQLIAFGLAAGAEVLGNWIGLAGTIAAALFEAEAALRGLLETMQALVEAAAQFASTMDIGTAMAGGFGAIQDGVSGAVGATQTSSVQSNQSVTVSAAGFGADELAAKVAAEVQNALRSLVPQVV